MSKPQFTKKEIANLHKVYKEAIYEVFYCQSTIRLSIDAHNPKLDRLLEEYSCVTWALITAYNPYSQCLSAIENEQRHQDLTKYLRWLSLKRSPNLTILDAVGKDKDGAWIPEKSVFIIGIESEDAIALGNRFEQNAIAFGELAKVSQLLWL